MRCFTRKQPRAHAHIHSLPFRTEYVLLPFLPLNIAVGSTERSVYSSRSIVYTGVGMHATRKHCAPLARARVCARVRVHIRRMLARLINQSTHAVSMQWVGSGGMALVGQGTRGAGYPVSAKTQTRSYNRRPWLGFNLSTARPSTPKPLK